MKNDTKLWNSAFDLYCEIECLDSKYVGHSLTEVMWQDGVDEESALYETASNLSHDIYVAMFDFEEFAEKRNIKLMEQEDIVFNNADRKALREIADKMKSAGDNAEEFLNEIDETK